MVWPYFQRKGPMAFHQEQVSEDEATGSFRCGKGLQWQELLVGGWATPLKNMTVNWDDYSQYMVK